MVGAIALIARAASSPVHDRHGKIQNHHVGPQLLNSIDGRLAILGLAADYPIGLLLQVQTHGVTNGRYVIDDKNPGSHGQSRPPFVSALLDQPNCAIHRML